MRPARRRTALSLALLIGTAAAGCGSPELPPPSEWPSFTSEDGRLTVRFPRAPKDRSETLDSPMGELQVRMSSVESRREAFLASHLSLPVSPAHYDVRAGLDGACEGAARNIGGEILRTAELRWAGLPGREVLIRAGPEVFCRARIFIDPSGPTLFQLQVVGDRSVVESAAAVFFLDSLVLSP